MTNKKPVKEERTFQFTFSETEIIKQAQDLEADENLQLYLKIKDGEEKFKKLETLLDALNKK